MLYLCLKKKIEHLILIEKIGILLVYEGFNRSLIMDSEQLNKQYYIF